MNYFNYGEKEIDYLKKRDKVLGKAIDRIGMIKREIILDPFQGLISSIVSQQISTKAAITVSERLLELVGGINPESIANAELEMIQKCGMSNRKALYIKGVGEAAVSKTVDFHRLHLLSDEEVIKSLTSLYGVGVWTAEMIMIFSLQRPDILSFKDLGIRRGIMNLYGLEELTNKDFEIYKERYSPYGSVASLYLWEISTE